MLCVLSVLIHRTEIFCIVLYTSYVSQLILCSGTIDFNLTAIPEPVQNAADCSIDQLPPEEDPDEEEGVARKRKAPPEVTLIDLFHKKRVKGWWPVYSAEEGERELMVSVCAHDPHTVPSTLHYLAVQWNNQFINELFIRDVCSVPLNYVSVPPQGKLELEMEILTEEEALLKPAAKARDEPNLNPHLEAPNRPATSFLWFTSPLKTLKHIIWKHYKWHIIGGVVIVLLVILVVIFIYTAPVSVPPIFTHHTHLII